MKLIIIIVVALVAIIECVIVYNTKKKLKVCNNNLTSTNVSLDTANIHIREYEKNVLRLQKELHEFKRDNPRKASKASNIGKPLTCSEALNELQTGLKNKSFKGWQVAGVKAVISKFKNRI